MKKFIYIFLFLSPVIGSAQQPWSKSSPFDYMWKNVGNAGFSAGQAVDTRLAFSPSGEPYVAYKDYANSQRATVMKFDGTNWINVGNAGFSLGIVWDISLAFSPSGQPYIAYSDVANSDKATVMKFDGTNWVNVGSKGFSAGLAVMPMIVFSPSGQAFVAYEDGANSDKATVMKFNGINWENVGAAGFSAGPAFYLSLAFSPTGQPYVAFEDSLNSMQATVLKYDSVFVGINNQQGSGFFLYPNPVSTKLTISIRNAAGLVNFVEIFELRGKRIFETQTDKDRIILNVENYPAGMYIVKVRTDTADYIGKFTKN